MSKKRNAYSANPLPRGLSVSLAGLRAGGALAVDSAVQRVMGREDDSAFARREAKRFAQELGRLKGTYVKIGQMLALFGEQFLPRVLVDALRDLADQTEPLHWDALETFARDSLGKHYAELEIDPEAVAAASLAQVHLAKVIATGEWICLKIQYPGLAQVIDADFDSVVRMLVLARWVKAGRELDDWLESMREHLHNEIDYRREARLTDRMGALVKGMEYEGVRYHVPQLYPNYCTDSILAMEFVEGFSVTDPDVTTLSLARRNALAKAMLELFFQEVYSWGLLQTDPNFGNYLLQLDDRRRREASDELVLLDFGAVLECPDDFLYHLRATIEAGQLQDADGLVEGLIGLGCLAPDANDSARKLFADFCLHLLEPLRSPETLPPEYLNEAGDYCWQRSRLMKRAGQKAASAAATRHFSAPSRDFALIARKLTGLFNFIAVLEAEFNAHDMVQTHIRRWRRKETRGQKRKPDDPGEKAIPTTRAGRFARMARLAGGVAGGMVAEGARQLRAGNRPRAKELLLTPANARKVTDQLATMRGAAMKVGQMLSMDTGDFLPKELADILGQLRSDARYMPGDQLNEVMTEAYGAQWESVLYGFEMKPFAAASIGQVHRAISPDGREIVLKVQYPGIAQSIDSDVDNIASLVRLSGLLPDTLDIAPLLEDAKSQLQDEADYLKEAKFLGKFGELLGDDERFLLPEVIPDLSHRNVLAMTYVSGQPIETVAELPQKERDRVMTTLFELMFLELFELRLVQTDPNFANYQYQRKSGKIVLLDFGATRRFKVGFVRNYKAFARAALAGDTDGVVQAAERLGYAMGDENSEYRELVLELFEMALETLAKDEPFDFAASDLVGQMSDMGEQASGFKDFWQAPPADAVFFHRKLGGMFMLASRLKARVNLYRVITPWLE